MSQQKEEQERDWDEESCDGTEDMVPEEKRRSRRKNRRRDKPSSSHLSVDDASEDKSVMEEVDLFGNDSDSSNRKSSKEITENPGQLHVSNVNVVSKDFRRSKKSISSSVASLFKTVLFVGIIFALGVMLGKSDLLNNDRKIATAASQSSPVAHVTLDDEALQAAVQKHLEKLEAAAAASAGGEMEMGVTGESGIETE